MKSWIRNLARRYQAGQGGFTLVELLVVVGIVVALAAVIVPNVIQFANRGTQGAQAAEADNVQSAMDAMMADKKITGVTGRLATEMSVNTWTALPVGAGAAALSGYLRQNATAYFYCYNSAGLVTRQDLIATLCP